jgi:hypothetical protein
MKENGAMRKLITRGWIVLPLALALAGCTVRAGGSTTISSNSSSSSTTSSGTGSTPGTTTTGSGTTKTESRAVSGFSSIVISGVGQLTIDQTGTESLTITADDNILPDLTSTVTNGQLQLGTKPNTTIQTNNPIQYHVTVKNLTGLSVAGAADATMAKLTTSTLSVEVSGTGSISIAGLGAQSAQINLLGAGEITLSGQAQSQTATIAGAGAYHGEQLDTDSAVVQVSGAGQAAVHVSQSLNATVSGAGTITYSGNPSQVSSNVTGAGSITQG